MIGAHPEFVVSDIQLRANFYVTGTMSRHIVAHAATDAHTLVESVGKRLSDMTGFLTIFDDLPRQSYAGLCRHHFDTVELGSHRGALASHPPDHFLLHLYIPADQFDRLLPLMTAPGVTGRLSIEVERTLDQGLADEDSHFWNDTKSPVVLFNEFRLTVAHRSVQITAPL